MYRQRTFCQFFFSSDTRKFTDICAHRHAPRQRTRRPLYEPRTSSWQQAHCPDPISVRTPCTRANANILAQNSCLDVLQTLLKQAENHCDEAGARPEKKKPQTLRAKAGRVPAC